MYPMEADFSWLSFNPFGYHQTKIKGCVHMPFIELDYSSCHLIIDAVLIKYHDYRTTWVVAFYFLLNNNQAHGPVTYFPVYLRSCCNLLHDPDRELSRRCRAWRSITPSPRWDLAGDCILSLDPGSSFPQNLVQRLRYVNIPERDRYGVSTGAIKCIPNDKGTTQYRMLLVLPLLSC